MEIKKIIGHIRNRDYMSGVEREHSRVKVTNEIFTPTARAIIDVHKLHIILFNDPDKTFQDQCCGDGQFLGEILIRKLESLGKEEISDIEFKQALSTIYGVDLMIDNVDKCREHLLCGREDLRHIVEQNIQCRDALKFGYNFEPMGPARRKTEERLRNKEKKLQLKKQKEEEQRIKKEKDNKMRQKNGLPLLA
jgi:hypothetical protein